MKLKIFMYNQAMFDNESRILEPLKVFNQTLLHEIFVSNKNDCFFTFKTIIKL